MWIIGVLFIAFRIMMWSLMRVTLFPLDDIESHLEDIMRFIVVPETFLFFLCVNIAQSLGPFRMFDAHL